MADNYDHYEAKDAEKRAYEIVHTWCRKAGPGIVMRTVVDWDQQDPLGTNHPRLCAVLNLNRTQPEPRAIYINGRIDERIATGRTWVEVRGVLEMQGRL